MKSRFSPFVCNFFFFFVAFSAALKKLMIKSKYNLFNILLDHILYREKGEHVKSRVLLLGKRLGADIKEHIILNPIHYSLRLESQS